MARGVARAPHAGRGRTTRGQTRHHQRGQRKPPPPVEAFFTTDLTLSRQDIVDEYGKRWAVEIEIRDANAFDGLGQDQCRKRQRVIGVTRFVWSWPRPARCGSWPRGSRHGDTALSLSALVQTENGPKSTRRGGGLSRGPP